MNPAFLNAAEQAATEAVQIGARIDHAAFGTLSGAERVEQKQTERWNPVTAVDRECETAIVAFLRTEFPDHTFLGEEDVAGSRASSHTWIIDPIDGTANFIHGIPHYGVSVGLAVDGELVVAACVDVERNELFTATRGGGAKLNGKPLPRRDHAYPADLSEAMICTGFYYDRGAMMERTLETVRGLFLRKIHGLRRTGSAVLDICWTAAGRFDAYFEHELGPWDFGPASLIAEECGVRVAASDGARLSLASGSIACAAPGIFDQFIELVAGG